MTAITVPASLDDAITELNGIGELLTATEWHRAAIVATFVRLGDVQGAHVSTDMMSPGRFAEFGIRGLGSTNTVRFYVQAWLDQNGGNYPAAGRPVKLPTTEWPPQARNAGSRTTTSNIGEQIADNPELARAAAAALAGGAVEHLDLEETHALGTALSTKLTGPKKSGAAKDPESDEAYWERVRAALHLVVDAQVRVAAGAEPPADVAMLMSIVLPRGDWDDAAAELIGDRS